jgi:hypothetical protein
VALVAIAALLLVLAAASCWGVYRANEAAEGALNSDAEIQTELSTMGDLTLQERDGIAAINAKLSDIDARLVGTSSTGKGKSALQGAAVPELQTGDGGELHIGDVKPSDGGTTDGGQSFEKKPGSADPGWLWPVLVSSLTSTLVTILILLGYENIRRGYVPERAGGLPNFAGRRERPAEKMGVRTGRMESAAIPRQSCGPAQSLSPPKADVQEQEPVVAETTEQPVPEPAEAGLVAGQVAPVEMPEPDLWDSLEAITEIFMELCKRPISMQFERDLTEQLKPRGVRAKIQVIYRDRAKQSGVFSEDQVGMTNATMSLRVEVKGDSYLLPRPQKDRNFSDTAGFIANTDPVFRTTERLRGIRPASLNSVGTRSWSVYEEGELSFAV